MSEGRPANTKCCRTLRRPQQNTSPLPTPARALPDARPAPSWQLPPTPGVPTGPGRRPHFPALSLRINSTFCRAAPSSSPTSVPVARKGNPAASMDCALASDTAGPAAPLWRQHCAVAAPCRAAGPGPCPPSHSRRALAWAGFTVYTVHAGRLRPACRSSLQQPVLPTTLSALLLLFSYSLPFPPAKLPATTPCFWQAAATLRRQSWAQGAASAWTRERECNNLPAGPGS